VQALVALEPLEPVAVRERTIARRRDFRRRISSKALSFQRGSTSGRAYRKERIPMP
jgi:hypothetical protein